MNYQEIQEMLASAEAALAESPSFQSDNYLFEAVKTLIIAVKELNAAVNVENRK